MEGPGIVDGLEETFRADPLLALAVVAALVAMASTPIAFAVLGRMGWFQARRGRTVQKPSFASVVVGMMLVMGIPAIFAALAIKSRSFDADRYEFDPNRTISPLDQGRRFEARRLEESLYKADEAVRAEMKRLAAERQAMAENVKKLDEAMLPLWAASAQSPAASQALPPVLERLAAIREIVEVDGPQQLEDLTAPPAALPAVAAAPAATPAVAAPASVPGPAAAPGGGLSEAEAQVELATVPEPQRALAGMLPLTDLPAGWVVGKSGAKHLETFNADNLYEKIDGRAESFLQYDVKGMAYAYYHPTGDEATEAQLYIFEMGDALKALGKYGSEKPEEVDPVDVGAEGYASAGSLFFHAGPYYTQIVSTSDDPKVLAFAEQLAARIIPKQKPAASPGGEGGAATPEAVFALLPEGSGRSGAKYAAQDVFGYSFLADVFLADYEQGGVTWQGFLRPYPTAEAARAVFEEYLDTAKQDGAEIQEVDAEGADRMVVCSNIGLVDVVFLKGNAFAGANGATEAAPAEAFAREFAKSLPATVPVIEEEDSTAETAETAEEEEKNE